MALKMCMPPDPDKLHAERRASLQFAGVISSGWLQLISKSRATSTEGGLSQDS